MQENDPVDAVQFTERFFTKKRSDRAIGISRTRRRNHFDRREKMSEEQTKPLNWEPDQDVGYSVTRRPDGGLHVVFYDDSHETIVHWREFAMEHLLGSDRLTRNLYDLRNIETLPEEAMRYALEANSDPAARNIRLAVLVSSEKVRETLEAIQAQTIFSTARIQFFSNPDDAEEWLSRPLTSMI
jgi:hypothetical protein